jgi:hypothetical protein
MINTVKLLISQFNLQTRLFKNVTYGVTDAVSHNQFYKNANHVEWLTGHIVSSRYLLAGLIGLEDTEPFSDLFQNVKGMDKDITYPAVEHLTKNWDSLSAKIASPLDSITEETLSSKLPDPVPNGDTFGDFIAFILHHEAYTIGQIGIYRKFLGLSAMSYN